VEVVPPDAASAHADHAVRVDPGRIGSELMTETEVRDAYAKRASEYISLFGSVDKANEQDQRFIAHWAKSLLGPVVDVGCGPGHWTAFLTSLGADAEGVDLVPAFVKEAKARFPDTLFRVAAFTNLGIDDGQSGGILAWYSEVHTRTDPGPRAHAAIIARRSLSLSAGPH
jgi:SAM-dependent methyltransferase